MTVCFRLADGEWHDASELERITNHPQEWLQELRHDPATEVKDDEQRVLVRSAEPVLSGSR
jgi:hypothetical protein